MQRERPILRFTPPVLLLAVAASVTAAEVWDQKPPREWTQEEALAVVTDSPWAQQVTLLQVTGRKLGVFGSGANAYTVVYQEDPKLPPRNFSVPPDRIEPELVRAVYAVRWSSAAMVQQALAQLKELAPVLVEAQAPPSELSPDHYVITVRVVEPPSAAALEALSHPQNLVDEMGRPVRDNPPSVSDLFAGLSPEELRARAELHTARKLHLKPDRVLRHGLGMSEGVSFFFPHVQNGQATLPPGIEWAEFVFAGAKGDKLKARFKLRDMQVRGQPDIGGQPGQ